MPISRQARMMRTAISPRLAIRIFLNILVERNAALILPVGTGVCLRQISCGWDFLRRGSGGGGAELRWAGTGEDARPSMSIYLFWSMTMAPAGCFSALAFLVAMVLSTHSSAAFRSAERAAGSLHWILARSRYIRFM